MKNLIKIILLILLVFSCNNKKNYVKKKNLAETQSTEYLIQRIEFIEYNTSVPANFKIYKYEQIEIVNDSAFLIEYTYKKGELNKINTLKSVELNTYQKSICFSLPNEYLSKKKYSIGNPSPLDESKFKSTITLKNKKKIDWEMSYAKKMIPIEIQPFFQFYFDIKQELHKKN